MRVSTFIILLIFACCGCGLLLFTSINYIHENELRTKEALTQRKLAQRDLSILEISFQQWLVLSDLILGSDQTYLQQGATELAGKIDSLKIELDKELKILPEAKKYLSVFDAFTARQSKRLLTAMHLNGDNRDEQLYDLLTEMDDDAANPIEALSALRTSLELEHQLAAEHIDHVLAKGRLSKNCLLGMFLLSIVLIWRLGSRKLGQPIERLTAESKQAMLENSEFAGVGQINQRQAEREVLHQEMVEMSRKAGMAEVASEVLHNVGNVLNSLNVSATLTRQQLETSAVKKLIIARDAITNNKADLAGFLTESKIGKHFPGALDVVTKQLENENRQLLDESDQLIENISHVKSIINMQQSFARAGGLVQSFCVDELISSALQIVSEALSSQQVVVEVECPRTLSITTDKDKLKQILVNLLSNACDSVVELDQSRTILISVVEEDGGVQVSVSDSGVGIAKENLNQLFRHGFTTKETGHGFGLHSCALAAQVLGGELEAESAGVGLGATFVLTIPKERAELCKV